MLLASGRPKRQLISSLHPSGLRLSTHREYSRILQIVQNREVALVVASRYTAKPIYVDVCALCRPFDDQSFLRIHMEAVAVDLIIAKARQGLYTLLFSPVHTKEIAATPNDVERIEIQGLMDSVAKPVAPLVVKMEAMRRTEQLIAASFGIADAAHVALSESAGADFITCDDQLLKKCRRQKIKIWCGLPTEFCEKENLE
jgi:hypothetical protein